jgi:hypothetical protein
LKTIVFKNRITKQVLNGILSFLFFIYRGLVKNKLAADKYSITLFQSTVAGWLKMNLKQSGKTTYVGRWSSQTGGWRVPVSNGLDRDAGNCKKVFFSVPKWG